MLLTNYQANYQPNMLPQRFYFYHNYMLLPVNWMYFNFLCEKKVEDDELADTGFQIRLNWEKTV